MIHIILASIFFFSIPHFTYGMNYRTPTPKDEGVIHKGVIQQRKDLVELDFAEEQSGQDSHEKEDEIKNNSFRISYEYVGERIKIPLSIYPSVGKVGFTKLLADELDNKDNLKRIGKGIGILGTYENLVILGLCTETAQGDQAAAVVHEESHRLLKNPDLFIHHTTEIIKVLKDKSTVPPRIVAGIIACLHKGGASPINASKTGEYFLSKLLSEFPEAHSSVKVQSYEDKPFSSTSKISLSPDDYRPFTLVLSPDEKPFAVLFDEKISL